MLQNLRNDIKKMADKQKGEFLQRYFKTGAGEYGEGDIFVGIAVPQARVLAKKYKNLSLQDIEKILMSRIHEERLIALMILGLQLSETYSIPAKQKEIYEFYLSHTQFVNNWDLVDSSADKIVGQYLLDKERSILIKLACSENVWERRIAIIATYWFIKNGEYEDTLRIAEILLEDRHDLVQKAVGWMLREVGKRYSQEKEEEFLKKYYKKMPRTMLRYAIERFPEEIRLRYLHSLI